MTVKSRAIFAAACIVAAAGAEQLEFLTKSHTNYFDEKVLNLAKYLSNNMHRETIHATQVNDAFANMINSSLNIDPDQIPNWMRAFYDDFRPESSDQVSHPSLGSVHSTQEYISAGLHAPSIHSDKNVYDEFVRSHHGATSIEPISHDFSYDDAVVTPNAGNR